MEEEEIPETEDFAEAMRLRMMAQRKKYDQKALQELEGNSNVELIYLTCLREEKAESRKERLR